MKRCLIRSSLGEVEERKSLIVKTFIRFPSRQQVNIHFSISKAKEMEIK